MLKGFAKHNTVFIGLYTAFLIAGAALITVFEKGDEILYFNQLHTPFLNTFFSAVTRIAEAPAYILAILFILFSGYGRGLLLLSNLLLTGLVVIFLKQVVFAGQVRPSLFFEGQAILNFVPGVEILRHNSFPSGHSATGFALFFMLGLFTSNRKWQWLFFTAALLIATSRVYLLQHFFRDVYAGSLVGVGVTTVFWLTFAQSNLYQSLSWKDKALFK